MGKLGIKLGEINISLGIHLIGAHNRIALLRKRFKKLHLCGRHIYLL